MSNPLSSKMLMASAVVLVAGGVGVFVYLNNNGEAPAGDAQNNGGQMSQAAGLPVSMPNVPVHQHNSVENSSDRTNEGVRDISLSLATSASVDEVNGWYAGALSSNGWSIKSDRVIGGYRIIQGENGDLYTSVQARKASEGGSGAVISQQIKVR